MESTWFQYYIYKDRMVNLMNQNCKHKGNYKLKFDKNKEKIYLENNHDFKKCLEKNKFIHNECVVARRTQI